MGNFDQATVTITFDSQYHIGSGYGLARTIDSLLRVNINGIPIIPGSTVAGDVGQGLYDLLQFRCFDSERDALCEFHRPATPEPKMPCTLVTKKAGDPCLLCFFMGSTAGEGVIRWVDFKPASDHLLTPLLESKQWTPEEREQYIKVYVSHKQNMRTRTVMERHLFVQEEGAPLEFKGTLTFTEPVPEKRAVYLAAAMANVRAIGRRKTRGKGLCALDAAFSSKDGASRETLTGLINKI